MSRFEDLVLKYSSSNRGLPAGNPIANIFVILVGALVIAASVVLGFFAIVVLGSIIAVLASVVGLRLWWFNRRLRRQGQGSRPERTPGAGGLIEGEYRVVDDKDGDRGGRG